MNTSTLPTIPFRDLRAGGALGHAIEAPEQARALRDDCLAWFLRGLAESDLKPALAFKGGTALKRCDFSDDGFPEDLDSRLREPLSFE